MRINPPKYVERYRDYKTKSSPKKVLEELRSRYSSEILNKKSFNFKFYKMPNRFMKMSLGYNGLYIPRYEWDKLKYRYGRMSKMEKKDA